MNRSSVCAVLPLLRLLRRSPPVLVLLRLLRCQVLRRLLLVVLELRTVGLPCGRQQHNTCSTYYISGSTTRHTWQVMGASIGMLRMTKVYLQAVCLRRAAVAGCLRYM